MITGNPTVRGVRGLTPEDLSNVKSHLQDAVYNWCSTNGSSPFALRDLAGGDNREWGGTPLGVVYDLYGDVKEAAKGAGRLLMTVLKDDQRNFNMYVGHVHEYSWDGK